VKENCFRAIKSWNIFFGNEAKLAFQETGNNQLPWLGRGIWRADSGGWYQVWWVLIVVAWRLYELRCKWRLYLWSLLVWVLLAGSAC